MIEKNDLSLIITAEEINSAINKLATDLQNHYEGKRLVFVCASQTTFMFASDLLRELQNDVANEFVVVKDDGSVSFNNVLTNNDVIILTDVINEGKTISKIYEAVEKNKPSTIKLLSLIDRPKNHKNLSLAVSSLFVVDNDDFICGYGMNYKGHYCNLKNIYIVKSSVVNEKGKVADKQISTNEQI